MLGQLVEGPGVVDLKNVAAKEEGQQEAQSAPHPRVKALNGDVHVVAFAERLEPIQEALLVAKLQVLYHADVDVEVHELPSKQLPRLALRPHQQDAGTYSRNEVVQSPPALDARPIDLEN